MIIKESNCILNSSQHSVNRRSTKVDGFLMLRHDLDCIINSTTISSSHLMSYSCLIKDELSLIFKEIYRRQSKRFDHNKKEKRTISDGKTLILTVKIKRDHKDLRVIKLKK